MKYYLAGGAVRDLLTGHWPQDLDFSFNGEEAEFLSLYPDARKTPHGPALLLGRHEYTPLRGDIQADLAARDFTMNSFLLEENGVLRMHPQALPDLRDRVLRPAAPGSLAADPLRVFRAARFCAMDPLLSPAPDCLEQIRNASAAPSFKQISAERVGRECIKALGGQKPGNFLRLLEAGQALGHWFEELAGAAGKPAGPPEFHKTDVLEHIAAVMDKTLDEFLAWQNKRPPYPSKNIEEIRALALWMALCHDLGKNSTPAEVLPHHYEHETRGMKAASNLARRLRLPERFRQAGWLAAKLHMKAGIYTRLRPSTRVDLVAEAQSRRLFIPLFLLAQADSGHHYLLELATHDLKIINAVTLPPEWRNLGAESGRRLRDLRCQAIPPRAVWEGEEAEQEEF
ncbi:HD domain-containing protein [Desulfovibrio sp. OttesenSCG-928-C14]|nr:HD domain-containing protein [Desulfovibrio sp. OttesenSCG-928-C14]